MSEQEKVGAAVAEIEETAHRLKCVEQIATDLSKAALAGRGFIVIIDGTPVQMHGAGLTPEEAAEMLAAGQAALVGQELETPSGTTLQ